MWLCAVPESQHRTTRGEISRLLLASECVGAQVEFVEHDQKLCSTLAGSHQVTLNSAQIEILIEPTDHAQEIDIGSNHLFSHSRSCTLP